MGQTQQPKPDTRPDDDMVIELARAIARGLAMAHHNAQTLPQPANEN